MRLALGAGHRVGLWSQGHPKGFSLAMGGRGCRQLQGQQEGSSSHRVPGPERRYPGSTLKWGHLWGMHAEAENVGCEQGDLQTYCSYHVPELVVCPSATEILWLPLSILLPRDQNPRAVENFLPEETLWSHLPRGRW